MSNDIKKSMLDAFIEQTYGSVEKAIEADKAADKAAENRKNLGDEFVQRAMLEMQRSQDIRGYVNIPTKNPIVSNPEIVDTGRHDLDKVRIKFKGEPDDGVEWGDLHDGSVGNWKIEP